MELKLGSLSHFVFFFNADKLKVTFWQGEVKENLATDAGAMLLWTSHFCDWI